MRPAAAQAVGRFIPAGAGNTVRSRVSFDASSGSSPLARGTLGEVDNEIEDSRFIPAGAGNTLSAGKRPTRLARFIPAGAGNTPSYAGCC